MNGHAANGVLLSNAIESIVRGCGCPVAIAVARPEFTANAEATDGPLDILLPLIGAEYSLAGAEVAVAMAKGCGARVTALHISHPLVDSDLLRRPQEVHKAERSVVRDMEALGRREGVEITVRALVRAEQGAAILQQIERGRHNLVVLGTKARTGEELSFGESAGVLLQHAPCSVALIAF